MQYTLLTIIIAIKMFVFARVSLRGSSYIFKLFETYMDIGTPSYTTTQMWVLKYGLYLLNKKKEKRDDWILVLDHTIEFGKKKCLVIIGIPRELLLEKNIKVQHKDFTLLDISITENADGNSVKERIIKIEKEIGTPIQFVCDGGGNLQKGIDEFIKGSENEGIHKTYDVTHKASLILKHLLEKDERWLEFTTNITNTKRSILHTALAFMSPPKPKEKSRWLNIEPFVKWAENALLQAEEEMNKEAKEKYKLKLKWVNDFQKDIKIWREMIDILKVMMCEIKKNGLSKKVAKTIIEEIENINFEHQNPKKMSAEITKYLNEETKNLNGTYLGCSDIIESIFGRYKNFSAKTPMKEVGKALLVIPIFTSDMATNDIKLAMETITEKQVKIWFKKNIGESLVSKRKIFCNLIKTKEKYGEKYYDNLDECA